MLQTRIVTRRSRRQEVLCWLILLLGVILLIAAGCSRQEDAAGGQHQQQHGGGHAAGGGQPGGQHGPRQAPEQQAIPIAVQPTTTGTIASYYNATATLEAEKQAQVLARVQGVVASLAVEEGDLVAEGDPLLTIDNGEYRLRLEQATAKTTNLRARFQRLEAMLAEQLTTEEEFQTARSDLASAVADEGLARLTLSYTTVAAPFTGRVTQRLVDVGQNLSIGTPLYLMADFNPLLARVHVPSREFNRLQQDQQVTLVLDSNDQRLRGRIKLISPVIDPSSGTIKVTIEVPEYPAGTRPGDFAEVRIVTETHQNTVLVPRAAVLTDKGESIVYVAVEIDGESKAERRIVEVGFTDDEFTEILSGLAVGELVVVKGQRSLKHGALLKILEGPTTGEGS